jgi:hypothetical protein
MANTAPCRESLLAHLLRPRLAACGRIARVAEALSERTLRERQDEHYTIPSTINVMIRASSPESVRSLNCAISATVNTYELSNERTIFNKHEKKKKRNITRLLLLF